MTIDKHTVVVVLSRVATCQTTPMYTAGSQFRPAFAHEDPRDRVSLSRLSRERVSLRREALSFRFFVDTNRACAPIRNASLLGLAAAGRSRITRRNYLYNRLFTLLRAIDRWAQCPESIKLYVNFLFHLGEINDGRE